MKTKIQIVLDVWPSGFISTTAIQASGVAQSFIGSKPDGGRRYLVAVEVEDPIRVDQVVAATAVEGEPTP